MRTRRASLSDNISNNSSKKQEVERDIQQVLRYPGSPSPSNLVRTFTGLWSGVEGSSIERLVTW